MQLKGTPRLVLKYDGTFTINGEAETKPEVIVQAMKEIAVAWGKQVKVPDGQDPGKYTAIVIEPVSDDGPKPID